MNNITIGTITVIVCSAGYWFAFRKYRQDNFHLSLLFIVLCGLILRVFVASDLFLHEWDERYHALVAKNLLRHPLVPTLYENPLLPFDYRNWGGNHIWLSKPIFPLWMISASIWIFGENEIAIRIPSILLSIAAIVLTYLIGKNLFNKKIGLLAAFLHSIHGLLIELAGGRVSSDHVETMLVFFTELSVLFCILSIKKDKNILYTFLAGISLGIAILCKWIPSLIVLPVWFCLIWFSKEVLLKYIIRNFFILVFTSFLAFLPWHIYIFLNYPAEAKWMLNNLFLPMSNIVEEHSGAWWYYLDKTRIVFGEIIYIPLLWFLWKLYKGKTNYKLLAVGAWWLISLIVFSISETKRQTYTMISTPAFFVVTAYFFSYCQSIYSTFRYRWLLITVMFLIIALPVRYSIERIKPFEKTERHPTWAQGLKKLDESVKEKNVVLFNTSKYIEAMFYTDFIAYQTNPSQEQINSLIEKGYSIFVCTNDSLQTFEEIK